jgi:hypothetical protein
MAGPIVELPILTVPPADHPLVCLYQAYELMRGEAVRHRDRCEAIAATPMTLAQADPADALSGADRDAYQTHWAMGTAYANAAYQQHQALLAVLDAFGGA